MERDDLICAKNRYIETMQYTVQYTLIHGSLRAHRLDITPLAESVARIFSRSNPYVSTSCWAKFSIL